MRVLVLHDRVASDGSPDALDVLKQAATVERALALLGHGCARFACDLDLERLALHLDAHRPDLVFNLVEGLGGHERLIDVVPALLETLAVPFTGAGAATIHDSTDKVRAKRILEHAGLPVAPGFRGADRHAATQGPWIVKSIYHHGSVALDDASVVPSADRVPAALDAMQRRVGGPCFAELFLPGREFNLSLLEGPAGPQVLPVAEMLFAGFPAGKPRIVGYDAKWVEDSFEYDSTPRTFDLAPQDRALARDLEALALGAWEAFAAGGYARVDFRLDADGAPHILELNANPCLSPEGGFAAAMTQAGIDYTAGIARILGAAEARAALPRLPALAIAGV